MDEKREAEVQVRQAADGRWFVEVGGKVIGEGLTQAAAWRLAERQETRPLWKNGKKWWWGH